MAYRTLAEANKAATRRRKGFRKTLKNVDKKEPWFSGKSKIKRKEFIRKSIKSIKIKKLPGKRKRSDTPYYLSGN